MPLVMQIITVVVAIIISIAFTAQALDAEGKARARLMCLAILFAIVAAVLVNLRV